MRIKVNDCEDKIKNRFDLVLLAAHRARQISSGGQALVETQGNKASIVALCEIAEGKIDVEKLKESLVMGRVGNNAVINPEQVATKKSEEVSEGSVGEMLLSKGIIGNKEDLDNTAVFEDVLEEDLID